MLERLEIEVGSELAVEPDEHVAIECGGDAERVVVGQAKRRHRLDQIGAE